MLKKILSLTLCLCMCLGVVVATTSCSSGDSTTTSKSTVPTTLSFLGITSELTSQENVQMVEDALNDIFSARFKTKIDLTLVTEDEYMDLIQERINIAEYYKKYDDSIAKYNAFIKKSANTTTTTDKIFGNWIANEVEISLDTLATRLLYVAEQTTVYEDGRVETLYPEATPIDIVMIVDEEMYDKFDGMGLLKNIDPNYSTLKALQKYVYPTYFTELRNLKGGIKAIPNNNILAESTYLVVDAELADKYDFNISSFKNYGDLADFLSKVKENEEIAPFKDVPEALGVFKLFSDDVAVGAYLDPLVGYNPSEGDQYSKFQIQNLFEIPQYVDHLALMEEYTRAGYFSKNYMANGYAVQVVTGDASVYEKYSQEGSEYIVKEIQIPFVLREAIFDGMLAPTAYSSNVERAMEIIHAINTDPAVKNLLQYGIEEYNYIPNEETGSVIRLNNEYMMDNKLTGNVYMGLLEEDIRDTAWAYVKQTNLASAISPFLIYPVDEAYLQDNLADILERAALSEALAAINIKYSDYANPSSSSMGVQYGNMLKNHYVEKYKDELIQYVIEDGKAGDAEKAAEVLKQNTLGISWFEEKIAAIFIKNNDVYSKVHTLAELEVLVGNKLSDGVVAYAIYEEARDKAAEYISNIESLEIITRITLFKDLSDEQFEKQYGSLSVSEMETAVFNYVRDNYIEENNITDEDYKKLVEAFIAQEFKFTNPQTKVEYTYSWEDFEALKEDAAKFSTGAVALRAAYDAIFIQGGRKQEMLDAMNDLEYIDLVLKTIRGDYYRGAGATEESFKKSLYDSVILAPYGITYAEFEKLKKNDNATYKEYVTKIKNAYKKELLKVYTKDEFATLTESKVLNAVVDLEIEEYTQAYSQVCSTMGLSREEYDEYYGYMEEYIKCVEKIRKSFTYTLRTKYTQAEISAMTIAEAEKAVYDMVYESGYYMNEVAKCIGITLSAYNNNKSQAMEYLGYLDKVVDAYAARLTAKGYDVAVVKSYAPEKIEDIIRDIIREEDFGDHTTIDVVLERMCKDSIAGLEETRDVVNYCKEQASALGSNYLFDALVGHLNENLQAELKASQEAN